MLSLLPDYADPLRLCALGKVYEGRIPLAELPRLAPLLTSTEGEAAFVLAFGKDDEQRPKVDVRISARLAIQCQRCLGEMIEAVKAESRLVVVSGPDEAERLPDELDPLLVEDERIVLRSLVEDELILAIPAAPMHPVEECQVDLRKLNAADEVVPAAEADDVSAENPFAALATLKRDQDKRD